jgi:uncharacterized protein YfaS (alpha-2-macroglobulin family)
VGLTSDRDNRFYAVQSLTDAFLYLQDYPFECTEQVASRVLSVAALRDVLSAPAQKSEAQYT